MATYIGTKYGDDTAQEWTSKKHIVIAEPTYSLAIETRHAERVRATRELLNQKMTSLTAEHNEILKEIATQPNNQDLMKERQQIDDLILKCEVYLNNEVEMKLTGNKKMVHSNAWCSHREMTQGLKKSRGKMYLLLLGQCTQVLVDKMKQDTTWVTFSESFNPILLFKLIKKFVLKQSDNQYKMAVLIAKKLSILSFHQDNQVPNVTYYNQFTTRVEVACQAGVCYYTPDFLDTKCVELSYSKYETLKPAEQKNVQDVVEQEYLTYLSINNSKQKLHSQPKKDVANNDLQGNIEAYSSDIHKALTLMNEYKLFEIRCYTPAYPRYGFCHY
jgi:hypothetical protein